MAYSGRGSKTACWTDKWMTERMSGFEMIGRTGHTVGRQQLLTSWWGGDWVGDKWEPARPAQDWADACWWWIWKPCPVASGSPGSRVLWGPALWVFTAGSTWGLKGCLLAERSLSTVVFSGLTETSKVVKLSHRPPRVGSISRQSIP